MNPLHSVFFKNATIGNIVKPDFFFLSGFAGIPHTKYYYVFLCFVYAVTVVGNIFVMFVIYTDHCLHSPKYIIVFNLAVSDLCGSTAVIPQVIDTFLLKSHIISFKVCLTHMFFAFWFVTMESLTLTFLSYDRYVAICHPLRYNEIVTTLFIVITYICIGRALLKIATTSERLKAMKTCTSHLMLVSAFYLPLGFALVLGSTIHQNARILNMSLATVLPPMLNPIIYSLKTDEFRESIQKLYRRRKIHINGSNK
ncbi:olfactory receptor 52E4-like [Conger conger]|uniref:olfactory receptor 52E4-like n=1 Tax=Conger conger TaxID=82655 RepID=UPI002A59DCBA|nr:olfactory receptor 52E4-like [Conger conger]